MKAYRIAAVAVSAVLLVALLVLLNIGSQAPDVPETTTTVTVVSPDPRNDGVVSDAERAAGGFNARLTLDVLNEIAQVACPAAAVDPDKAAVRRSVLAKAQQIRPGVSPQTMAALTDRVAALACADAFGRLPEVPQP